MASIARQASEDSASGSEPEDNSDYSDSENEDDEDDEEEWEYVSGDEEEQEEIQIKTAAPFTLYKDTTSLANLRNKMITDVTNMLACSRDIAPKLFIIPHTSSDVEWSRHQRPEKFNVSSSITLSLLSHSATLELTAAAAAAAAVAAKSILILILSVRPLVTTFSLPNF
jgi:hypothetical protein